GPGGLFDSPAGEFGTLKMVPGAGYRYTSEFGESWAFDDNGQLQSITDRNGLGTSFGYIGSVLSTVTAIDGNPVTVSGYALGGDSYVEFLESHGRAVTLALPESPSAPAVVQSITDTDPANTRTRSFSYTNGLVSDETWGTQVTHYRYRTGGRI